MAKLTGSVGEAAGTRGVNRHHDVAVVQLLLRVAKDPKSSHTFFNQNINGLFDHATLAAIRAFQEAWGLAAPPPKATPKHAAPKHATVGTKATGAGTTPSTTSSATAPTTPAATPPDKYGLIEVDSATFRKLLEEAVKVKPEYDRLRALPTSKYLYLESTDAQFQVALRALRDSDLAAAFKTTVTDLVNAVYRDHKIALSGWSTDKSYLRSFRFQHQSLASGSSQAHPGESLHQYGQAIDIGYNGLVVILENGRHWEVTSEDDFDNLAKHHGYGRQNALFKARNDLWEAPPQGRGSLFRIRLHHGKDDDPNHFQAFNQFPNLYPDASIISLSRSLADHLSLVSGMSWEMVANHEHHYACDLGLGIDPIDVGTADQIWSGHPQLSKAQFDKAIKDLKPMPDPKPDYHKVLTSLTDAFKAAETRWSEWVARQSDGSAL